MADEFIKGLGIVTGAGLGWVVLAGWFNTPSFSTQLLAAPPENLDAFGRLAIALKEVLFWFMIFGALVFWVLIPAINRIRGNTAEGEGS